MWPITSMDTDILKFYYLKNIQKIVIKMEQDFFNKLNIICVKSTCVLLSSGSILHIQRFFFTRLQKMEAAAAV